MRGRGQGKRAPSARGVATSFAGWCWLLAWPFAPIAFDVGALHPRPNDPKSSNHPPGSAQAFANDNFNCTCTSLLKTLHGLFNGANTRDQMNDAIALMMSLKGQAKAMMAGIPNPSAPNTGPSFECQPANPRN